MAEGDIGAVIATLTYDDTRGKWPAVIHIAGDVYAVAYDGPDNDGWIKTVTINSAGAMALVGGGSLEFEAGVAYEPDIIHIGDEVYAIAYRGPDDDGWIKTVTITAAGAIALVGGGVLEFDTEEVYKVRIIHVTGDVYVIAHTGGVNVGELTTITITAAGAIALVSGGNLEFDAAKGLEADIIHVAGEVYAIAYRGPDDDGWIKTVTINSAGAMALVGGGSLEFDTSRGKLPTITHIDGEVYAIAYDGPDDDGWIKTVTITAAGAIALVGGGSLEFDTVQGTEPDIIHVSGNVYAVAYRNGDNKAQVKTVTITDAGAISFADSTGLVISGGTAYEPDMIHVTGNIYACLFKDPSTLGKIKSFDIETVDSAMIRLEMLMGIG